MASGAAKRYVQAIVEIAREQQSFDAWQADFERFEALTREENAFAFLGNPSVPDSRKKQAVDVVLKDTQPEARNLAHLLIERQRVDIIPDLVEGFREAMLAEQGIVRADVTTAEPLGPSMQEAVREHIATLVGKQVQLRMHTDPDIIGGLIARIGDQVIDGSVQTRLRRLRTRLRTT
jgi:F-type H+-transporting ATPase subunit delta